VYGRVKNREDSFFVGEADMIAVDLSGINLLAVVVAGLAHMLVGLLWFSRGAFGKTWMSLTGRDMKPASKWIPLAVLGHVLIALVLSIIMVVAGATSLFDGFLVAVTVWLGFVVTLEIGELVWEKIPLKLFLIRIGDHLIALSVAGIILAAWP
jgi:uncharacterized protein DUF1761